MTETNYSMLCDFTSLQCQTAILKRLLQKTVYFDLFFRKVPDNGGFAIAAGLEQVIDYIKISTSPKPILSILEKKNF